MAFRIANPNWKSPVQLKAEAHAPAVAAWLVANAGSQVVGLSELRAGLPAISGELSRAVVNQICVILKLDVSGAEDQGV